MAQNSKSLIIAKQFLTKEVEVIIDRPFGSRHPEHGFVYEVNYGYIPDTTAPDGESLDAYYLGIEHAMERAFGTVIAIVHRLDNDDDKVIVMPNGMDLLDREIEQQITFQEKWFKYRILRS